MILQIGTVPFVALELCFQAGRTSNLPAHVIYTCKRPILICFSPPVVFPLENRLTPPPVGIVFEV